MESYSANPIQQIGHLLNSKSC